MLGAGRRVRTPRRRPSAPQDAKRRAVAARRAAVPERAARLPPRARTGRSSRTRQRPPVVAEAFRLRADGVDGHGRSRAPARARDRAVVPRRAGAARVAHRARRTPVRRARERATRTRRSSTRTPGAGVQRDGRRADAARSRNVCSPVSGVLRCGTCGARMVDRHDAGSRASRTLLPVHPASRLPPPRHDQRRCRRDDGRRGRAGACSTVMTGHGEHGRWGQREAEREARPCRAAS